MDRIAVFAGAGISKEAPSNLPSWWDYNKYVLEAIQKEASTVFTSDKPLYSSEKMLETLPVTSISDVLFTCGMGEIYFNMVSCLEGSRPNMNHFILANMAKNGYLACIVTTNFDTLIEQAFDGLKVPYKVLLNEEDYTIDAREEICLIVKLHGSVNSTTSLIDTVTQKMKGLTARKKELLRAILCRYSTYVIGMSGEDLRFDLDYFQFISANTRHDITWVKHPKGRLSPMVNQLTKRINLLIVEEEIQTLFRDYIYELSMHSLSICEDEQPPEISEKIDECVSSFFVGPFVCMGIVLLLLCDAGETVRATQICQKIIGYLDKEPEIFYDPFGPQISPLLHNMGVVLINTGSIELAIQTIQKSISIQSHNYLQMRKLYYSNEGLMGKLTSDYSAFSIERFVAEYHRNMGNDYINLGVCYFKRRENGDFEKAEECYQKALDAFIAAGDDRGINLATSSLSEICFNQTSFGIFHNSEEEYNHQIKVYFDTIDHAKQHGDFETYVSASCLLAKLFMEYGEYGSAERQIASLTEYMDINISIGSKVRYQEIKAEWYIRHNMEEECRDEIEEAFQKLEKSGDDIYLKRNLCLRAVMLLGHSVKNLDYTKRCLEFLKESQNVNTIDRYYDVIPVNEAISLVDEKKTIFSVPVFYAIGKDYLKEKSKVIRAAIVRATFYNDKEMLVLLFEKLVSECLHKIDIEHVCRICFAYVEASKRLAGGIYKYESTYTLISCLQMAGLDTDGKISLQYIDDVLDSDDLDQPENNEIVGRLYYSKSHRLLFSGDYSESEKYYVAARDKLCSYEAFWKTCVKDRVDSLIQLNRKDMIFSTLQLSYPYKSKEDIEAIYQMIY